MARILGVDLGTRRVGLAVSDPAGRLATPRAVLERSADPTRDRKALLAIAREAGASRIVVGLPRSLSGELGPAARAVLDEVEALRAEAGDGVDIETHDERYSTVTAERMLAEAGTRPRARRRVVDQAAAAVMLQSYLDSRRRS